MAQQSLATWPSSGLRRRATRGAGRRGLAPLEFVLWLPILCFVAALMVNLGTMTAWRVRGENVAREAVWRTRWPRTGHTEPRPAESLWPANATMTVHATDEITALDDQEIDHEVVRGPLDNGFQVNQVLRPDQGAVEGESSIERDFPLLPKLGQFRSGPIRHMLLDTQWQAAPMGIPANVYRRIKILYELPTTDPSLPRAFEKSVEDMLNMANYDALRVLDRDEEIRQYYGMYVDFHPRVRRMCELDPEVVEQQAVKNPADNLVDIRNDNNEIQLGRISRLPGRMTNFFLNMYRSTISRLEDQIQGLEQEQDALPDQIAQTQRQIDQLQRQSGDDPGVENQVGDLQSQQQQMRNRLQEIPGEIRSAEQEIATLQDKLPPLEAYQKRLPELEERLRQQAADYIPLGG